jgi:hypothetical protein
MNRKAMKMLLVALIAVFAVSSMAEAAAPKKVVRHRTKHSSRVSAGAAATNGKAAVTRKKPAPAAKAKTAPNSNAPTPHKPAAKKPVATRRTPTTKPR